MALNIVVSTISMSAPLREIGKVISRTPSTTSAPVAFSKDNLFAEQALY